LQESFLVRAVILRISSGPEGKEDPMNDDKPDPHRERIPTGDLDAALPGSPVLPLRRLHDFRIAEGDPDVRGWEVLGADGRKIGVVDDLLVDTGVLKARYLEVILDPSLFEEPQTAGTEPAEPAVATADTPALASPLGAAPATGGLADLMTETVVRATLSDEENRLTAEHHHGVGSRRVLIPIGYARLDGEHDRIVVEGLRAADAAGLPDYDERRFDRDYEAGLRRWFDRTYSHAPEHDFYAHGLYDEDRFYGPRRQPLDRADAIAENARAAGLEAGGATPAGEQDRTITGELDRAVHAPDHSVLREEVVAPERR
jgi:PRC-barrel domain protein